MLPQNVRCPKCKSILKETNHTIVCEGCDACYQRKYGIPVLLDERWDNKDMSYQDRPYEQAWFDNYVLQDVGKSAIDLQKGLGMNVLALPVADELDALGLQDGENGEVSILAAGCGYGFYSNELKARGYAVIGVDLSIESLKINLSLYPENISERYTRLICCDLLALPFEDASFDFVFCAGVLHHFKDPSKTINEFYRVIKSGVFGREPNGNNFINVNGRSFAKIFLAKEQTGTLNETVHSADNYYKLFKTAGFKSVEIIPAFPTMRKLYTKAGLEYFFSIWTKGLVIIRNVLLVCCWNLLPAKYGGSLLLIKAKREKSDL